MNTYHNYINGKPVDSKNKYDVINPATGKSFAQVSAATSQDVDMAVAAAREAFLRWRETSDTHRAEVIAKLAKVLEDNMPELMELVCKETGKPLGGLNDVGAGMEVGGSIAWTQYTAGLTLPVDLIQDDAVATVEVHRKPLGVVASITPWNWPLMIAIWHLMPALRTGNTVVIKPSPFTPVATMRFVQLANEILPPGVLNVVAGGPEVGATISQHPDVNKIVFTGSTETGKRIMQSAAGNLKRLTLELGGNDAAIVLPDVDIDEIAPRLFGAAFHNNGQTCACLKRLYVHEDQYEQVCAALVTLANEVKIGDGLETDTQLGPLQNARQLAIVEELVADAIANGATLLAGGTRIEGPGYFHQATIIGNISEGTRLVDEEQFGPVLPIITYRDVDEVLERANRNESGLGGSIWSSDIGRAKELALKKETGSVWINDHGSIQPDAPFGGVKQSGVGVEFGQHGLEEYVSLQTVKVSK